MDSTRSFDPARMVDRRQLFFACPHCGADDQFQVTHFLSDGRDHPFGPWQCKECGRECAGEWLAAEEAVRLTRVGAGPATIKGYALLKLDRGAAGPLWFVVEHDVDASKSDPLENAAYLYEEHHCPTNFVPVAGIIDGDGNEDAHGLFEYVEWAPEPERGTGWDRHDEDAWAQIFPRLRPGGLTIEGSAREGEAIALPPPGR
jgi:hypothetical protein